MHRRGMYTRPLPRSTPISKARWVKLCIRSASVVFKRSLVAWLCRHVQLHSLERSPQAVQSETRSTDRSATGLKSEIDSVVSNASDKLRRAQKTDGLNPQEFQLPLAVSLGVSARCAVKRPDCPQDRAVIAATHSPGENFSTCLLQASSFECYSSPAEMHGKPPHCCLDASGPLACT